MQIINNFKNITSTLNQLIANDEYTSIGYVPTLNIITASDIVAIKNAKKLLDIVIVQNISNLPYDDFSLSSLQKLNPNLIINLIEEEPKELAISLYIEQISSFNLVKGILSILPSSVFISQDNFAPFKAVNVFNDNFTDMFSLHNISAPESVKSFTELEVIRTLQSMENKNIPISAENIAKELPELSLADFQEYKNAQGLFINISLKDIQTTLVFLLHILCVNLKNLTYQI